MCPLTGLWALAVLSLSTSHPRESSAWSCWESKRTCWAWGRSQGEPGVFAEHCPVHTNRLTLIPIIHYRARVSQAHRNLRLGQRWYLFST